MPHPTSKSDHWWKHATGYQVWPSSFKDSTGSGRGDIQGIISKLDYLKDLGIDLIWLSPMYPSPDNDYGYDVADYTTVNPKLGTMQDMENLIAEMDGRGMRLILDLVANHTSSEHKWFKESAASKSEDNEKRDWYIWRPPKYIEGERKPPSNWQSFFGGSAWEYVPARDEYYLHLFDMRMPDFNWEDKEAREAIYENAIRFWLRKGVKGFRIDTANIYAKDTTFKDAPVTEPDEEFQRPPIEYIINHDQMHKWLKEERREALDAFGDMVMIGEMNASAETPVYTAADPREYDSIFDTALLRLTPNPFFPMPEPKEGMTGRLLKYFANIQNLISERGAWGTVFTENHDTSRSIESFATSKPEFRVKAAKLLTMLQGTLSGTLFVYQGQEIGMMNVPSTWTEDDLRDPPALRAISDAKAVGDEKYHEVLGKVLKFGRDNCRTPVQWSSSENAGFTTGKPWMEVNDNYKNINAEQELADQDSILNFWKKTIKLRKKYAPVFVQGKFKGHNLEDHGLSVFSKSSESGQVAVVLLNFTDDTVSTKPSDLPEGVSVEGLEVLLHNQDRESPDALGPWEGKVFISPGK